MKTPNEYNEEFLENLSRGGLNIKCPFCSENTEMVESSPNIRLLSCLSQKRIHCPVCGYSTTVYCH